MSSTTDHFFEVKEQQRRDWICTQLEDYDADEDTPGWDDFAQDWQHMQDFRSEQEQELGWYELHSYSDIHQNFNHEIQNLKDLLEAPISAHHEETFYKMIYAHAVTLMESFLSDSVRSLILSDERYFVNAIKKVDDLKNCKFSITEIAQKSDGAKGFAVTELAKVMFHNIPKVKRILQLILNKKVLVDISEVTEITSFRHDIVHRDGKSIEGDILRVDKDVAMDAIAKIGVFVTSIAEVIHSN